MGLKVLTEEACQVAAATVVPCSSAEAFLVEAYHVAQIACLVEHPSEVVEAYLVGVADHLAVAVLTDSYQAGVGDQVVNVEASGQALGNQAAVP